MHGCDSVIQRDEPLLVAVTARKVCRPIGREAIRHQWFDQCSFSTGRYLLTSSRKCHKKKSKQVRRISVVSQNNYDQALV